MDYLLFLNPFYGPDSMLRSKLKREDIEVNFLSIRDEGAVEIYKAYGIRTTPVLLVLDKEVVTATIKGTDEIVKEFKKHKDE
jgi:hypothetical protein